MDEGKAPPQGGVFLEKLFWVFTNFKNHVLLKLSFFAIHAYGRYAFFYVGTVPVSGNSHYNLVLECVYRINVSISHSEERNKI